MTSKLIEEAKNTIRDIKNKGKLTFNIGDDFFNQFLDQRFDLSNEEINKIKSNYILDDISDEESDDKPIKLPKMSMVSKKIFSLKPEEKQIEIIKETPKKQILIDKIPKKIMIDSSTQSYHGKKSVNYNFPIDIFPEKKIKIEKSYNSISTLTKSTKYRNELTNTDALLPQYETKCLEFIQNVLNESPIIYDKSPSKEYLTELLVSLINDILLNAPNDDFESISSQIKIQIPEIEAPLMNKNLEIPQNKFINSFIQKESKEIQSNNIELVNNGTQIQSTVSIKNIQKSKIFNLNPSKFPYNNNKLFISSTNNLNKLDKKNNIIITNNDHFINIEEFEYPPPLKTSLIKNSTKSTSPIESKSPFSKNKQNLQLETLIYNKLDIPPNLKIIEDNKPLIFSKEPLITEMKVINEIPKKKFELPPLPSNFEIIKDIEEISNLNMDSILAEIEEEEISELNENSSNLITNQTINSSTINKLLEGIDDSNSNFSKIDINLSSGEIENSTFFSETSSIYKDSL